VNERLFFAVAIGAGVLSIALTVLVLFSIIGVL
jgi:hypothetical protein